MSYLCVQCDEHFESEEARPRCPKCMRVNGIHSLDGDGKSVEGQTHEAAPTMIGWGPSLALTGLVIAGIAFYVLQDEETAQSTGDAVDPAPALVAGDALAKLLVADGAIEGFATTAAGGAGEGLPRARAIVAALRARASAMAFVPWSRVEPRDRGPMVAAAAYARIAEDASRAKLYPLEVAAVAVAAMRHVGVEAQVTEVFWFEGDRSPPDPSGRLGYFAVAVGEGAALQVLDPYAGREARVAAGDHTVLTDAQAIAAAISLRGIQQATPSGDMRAALRDSELALKVLPRSPSVRGGHGLALLLSGAGPQAMAEFEAARQLRDDAPRNLNVGFAYLAKGDVGQAATFIARSLEQAPDYAVAHMNLARLHMAQANREQAYASLEAAQRLDPDMPALALVWAAYHMAIREWPQAMVRAKAALEAQPENPEAHITVAKIYRELGNYDAMRLHARMLLDLVSESQRARTRDLIIAMLGVTALEEPDDEDEDEDEDQDVDDQSQTADAGVKSTGGRFDLRAGSRLLGGRGGAAKGGLQLGGQKPTLLRGSGDGMKLRLDL